MLFYATKLKLIILLSNSVMSVFILNLNGIQNFDLI